MADCTQSWGNNIDKITETQIIGNTINTKIQSHTTKRGIISRIHFQSDGDHMDKTATIHTSNRHKLQNITTHTTMAITIRYLLIDPGKGSG